ncbi:carbohydrate ABC transporter permease [Nocardioides mesophilus]|uniref:Carbohydrate ABC transporter permease n=1 Tax=Nocardioides mesophilus TaxID=433659 RepID=A0A7G9REZ6_9ACTN|nr:carbohydrate ABC transporter permease [Nocardioides mesophilus]QNN54171.1 carbohydrate ABC transporter permease [Nocardioides mesophilus]
MRTSRAERTTTYVVLVLAAMLALYPIGLILVKAVQPDAIGAASGVDLGNFAEAWDQGEFGSYLRTSVIVTACVVVGATLLSSLAGYAFGTMRFRGSTALFYLLLLGLMVPSEAVVIPLYFQLRSVGLLDTYTALVLPQIAQSLAFGTFWMRAYFRSTSREVVEAARLDGAGHLRIFWSILLPMGRPAVTTMMVLFFMWTWNEFLLPLVVIPSGDLLTAPLGLALFQGQYTAGTSLLAAGAVMVAFPVVVFYLFAQRHFIRGMVDGATKG